MKIAFIVEGFPKLSETFIISQIVGLIDRGHEVDIYADSSINEDKTHPDVEKNALLSSTFYLKTSSEKAANLLHAFYSSALSLSEDSKAVFCAWNPSTYDEPRVFPRFLLPLLATTFIKQSKEYDVIHCHFGKNGLKAAFLKRVGLIDSKIVTTFHGIDLTSYINSFGTNTYDRLFEFGDLFLPISERWQQRLVELGCDRHKTTVHHMGVDCRKFSFKHRSLNPDSQIRLISIARLVEKKGLEYAIRAVAKLVEVHQNLHYTIIGDGPLRQELEDLVDRLKLRKHIAFLGWRTQQEVIDELDRSDVLLAPSVTSKEGDQEGIPVTLMEAMAIGLPVVSTWHSGIPELIEDGVSGYLVAERDVDALAHRIAELASRPKVYLAMSIEGRRRIEKSFNSDKLNDQLVDFYAELISGR